MRNIEHYRPEEINEKGGDYIHRLDLMMNRENIGEAQLIYKNSPFPFYYLSSISIRKDVRGKGEGKNFLVGVNNFLLRKRKAGILVNSIDKNYPENQIYANNGWEPLNNDYYIFNPPKNLTPDRIKKAVYEIEEMMT